MTMNRPSFATFEEYAKIFTDAAYWRPYVEHVWASHRLGAVHLCVAGLPGTNPVFLVNDSLAVKFYPDLFGFHSDNVELAFYSDIQPRLQAPTPVMLAKGSLFEPTPAGDWHYPYVVTSLVEGTSFGQSGSPDHHTRNAQVDAARFCARILRAFHNCPLPKVGLLRADWNPFEQLLARRRREIRDVLEALPATDNLRKELLNRLDTAPSPFDKTTMPKLLHGDLNRDHVFVRPRDDGTMEFTGVIDFGDVKIGDPLYDLVPLHFGLFNADKTLLRIFLDTYDSVDPGHSSRQHSHSALPNNFSQRDDFAMRAMDYTLLYEWDVLSEWFEAHEEARTISSLSELRELLWGVV